MSSSRLIDGEKWIWALCLGLIVILASRAGDIFSGVLPGIDDLMRLQQVRDLLSGQNWFNVDQSRFLTPEGGDIHWSRVPDIFLASVIWLTRPLLGQAGAEAFASVLWPLLLLGVSLAAIVTIARRLQIGLAGQAAAIILFALSAAIYNFWPGRIDHHNFVVAMTLVGLAALLSPTRSAQSGWILGFCIAAGLTVAIEGLPYFAALIFGLGLFWIVRGHNEAPRLAAFGLSLLIFASLFYVFDAPGAADRVGVCDAYGQSHYVALMTGGVLLLGLGLFSGLLEQPLPRLVAGGLAGSLAVAAFVITDPACLGDPYADVSDQVRLAWLSIVQEARTLPKVWTEDPAQALWKYGFVLAGLVGAVGMIFKAENASRLAWAVFSIILGLSALATVWQVRGTTFSHIFAAIAAGGVIGVALEMWMKKRGAGPALVLFATAFALSPIGWQMTAKAVIPASDLPPRKPYNMLCIAPDGFDIMAEYPASNVFSPIDLGVSLLARTPHRIYAGPYHRNVGGIERVTEVLLGPTDEARDKIHAMGADHLAYCQGLNETHRYAKLAPTSFAADMEAGRVPDWLVPVDGKTKTDGVARLYRVIAEAE